MKVVQPGFELLEIPEPYDRLGVLKHLERIGRICYKSEEKITDDSCIKFIENIRNRKHWAMLEHYIFTFSVPKWVYDDITDRRWLTIDNPDYIHAIQFIRTSYWPDAPDQSYRYLVSGSATAFNYLWGCQCLLPLPTTGIPTLCRTLSKYIPEIMMVPGNHNSYQCDDSIRFITTGEMKKMPERIRLIHDFRSVIFTVDRGVTHELVRHRPASWAQESTRYCNYSKGKYENEITTINPCFFDDDGEAYDTWKMACKDAEEWYMELINCNATPQEARTVLPNSVKADICMTARLWEYIHFFRMRLPKTAHPQMREVVVPLLGKMKDSCPGAFDRFHCDSVDEDLVEEGTTCVN